MQVLLVCALPQLHLPRQLPRLFRTRAARIKCRQPKNRLPNCLYLLAGLVFQRAVALRFRVCLRGRVLYIRRTQAASLLREAIVFGHQHWLSQLLVTVIAVCIC